MYKLLKAKRTHQMQRKHIDGTVWMLQIPKTVKFIIFLPSKFLRWRFLLLHFFFHPCFERSKKGFKHDFPHYSTIWWQYIHRRKFVVSKIENIPIFIYQYVLKTIYDIVGILCIDKMVEDDKYDSNLTLRSYKVVYLCNSHLQFNQQYIHFHLIQKM